jgi:hypothetical protein
MKSKRRTTKSQKAVTLLTRVESLLSDALEEYSVIEKQVERNVRTVLRSAQASVSSALDFIGALNSSASQPKAAKSRKSRRPRPSARRKTKRAVRA